MLVFFLPAHSYAQRAIVIDSDASDFDVIDTAQNAFIANVTSSTITFNGIARITPDGKTAYVAGHGANIGGGFQPTVSIYDLSGSTPSLTTTINLISTCPCPPVRDLAISPDGSSVYIALANGTMPVIDTATTPYPSLKTGTGYPLTLAIEAQYLEFTPDGTRLYADGGGGYLTYVDTTTDTPSGSSVTIDSTNEAYQMTISPDASKLVISSGQYLHIYRPADNSLDSVSGEPYCFGACDNSDEAYDTVFTDNNHFITNGQNNDFYLFDYSGSSPSVTSEPLSNAWYGPVGLSISPDKQKLFVTAFFESDFSPYVLSYLISGFTPIGQTALTADPGEDDAHWTTQAPTIAPIYPPVVASNPSVISFTIPAPFDCLTTGDWCDKTESTGGLTTVGATWPSSGYQNISDSTAGQIAVNVTGGSATYTITAIPSNYFGTLVTTGVTSTYENSSESGASLIFAPTSPGYSGISSGGYNSWQVTVTSISAGASVHVLMLNP